MTSKSRKTKAKKAHLRPRRSQRGKIARLRASAERPSIKEELLRLAEDDAQSDSRWNRPRKQRISLRVDCEVVDWFKSTGPGYQTRINRILRKVMMENKKKNAG